MKRIGYAIATVILLLTEVLIALYVHDAFVRPYIGDVLVCLLVCKGEKQTGIYTISADFGSIVQYVLCIWMLVF